MNLTEKDERRFWAKVGLPDGNGCMPWLAYRTQRGYGHFQKGVNPLRAHRVSYTLRNGEIPEGLVINHICRNTWCVAPDHLEAITHQQNSDWIVNRRFGEHNKRRTHCPRGHAYEGENLYVTPKGSRICRTCRRAKQRKRL